MLERAWKTIAWRLLNCKAKKTDLSFQIIRFIQRCQDFFKHRAKDALIYPSGESDPKY